MENQLTDKRANFFFNVACNAALESNYDGSKVGAVIVKDGRIVSTGWNGYPAGADDEKINKMDRLKRLDLVIHAEVNAVLNAAQQETSIKDAVAFVTHQPCTQCLAKMQNAGIAEVRYIKNRGFEAAWCDSKVDIYLMIPLYRLTFGYSLSARPEATQQIYRTLDKYQTGDE
jgi:dCMP deaminase